MWATEDILRFCGNLVYVTLVLGLWLDGTLPYVGGCVTRYLFTVQFCDMAALVEVCALLGAILVLVLYWLHMTD